VLREWNDFCYGFLVIQQLKDFFKVNKINSFKGIKAPCLFTIISFFLLNSLFSQTVVITDFESNQPLEYVTLLSENPKAFVTTNAKGEAKVEEFKQSEAIEIRTLGYKTEVFSYTELEELSFKIGLQSAFIGLDGVVISATRSVQKANDIPSKITSISIKEIKLQNPQTAADLLSISGKVFIQKSQQGGGSPMIRGFATNRLLYTVDGVRMNNAIFRGGNIQNVISLDPFAIEHTEVFFGPGSVIYGSDAIGGVMSFKTLSPKLSTDEKLYFKGNAVTRYSSASNEKTGNFDVNFGLKKWAFLTSASLTDFGDLKMGSEGPNEYLRPTFVETKNGTDIVVDNPDSRIQAPSGYSQFNLTQKIRFKPTEKLDVNYGFHYSETSDYARYDRHIRSKNGLPLYGEWSYGPQKWMMNNLSLSSTSKKVLYDEVTVRLAQQRFEESRITRNFNSSDREINTEKVDAYSANVDFVKKTHTKNTLYYGAEVVTNIVNSKGVSENIVTNQTVQAASRYPEATWNSYGVYASNQFRVTEKTLLQGGLRYSSFGVKANFDTSFYKLPFTSANLKNDALTGSFGIVFRPNKTWVINSNASSAFRSPNVDDMGKIFDSEPGAITVPNPTLKAEYAYNFDLGIAKMFGDAVKADVTGYYTHLKNAMIRRAFNLNGEDSIVYSGVLSEVQAIQNAAVAKVYGIQAGIEVKVTSNFRFSSDYNYQIGEEELDNGEKSPSRHAAPWFGNTRLKYEFKNLVIEFYALYSGGKSFENLPEEEKGKDYIYAIDSDGNPYSPSWYTLNLKAMYQVKSWLSASAGIENIADKRYRPYSSGIVSPGRNFIFSLRCNF
jgi:hemoglobin/transferrin/lactoferrin receptor protein